MALWLGARVRRLHLVLSANGWRTVGQRTLRRDRNVAHLVFLELMKRIIEATSNSGDTVLDPMMGSGTTGEACRILGREFIGIEKNEKYFKMAEERIAELPLFANA